MSRAGLIAARNRAMAVRAASLGEQGHTHITLVEGPPCSGKSRYVQEHMEPGDLVIDYDAIAVALGSPTTHDHPADLVPFIHQARQALLERVTRASPVSRAWLISCEPTPSDRQLASATILLDVDADTCKERAHASGRPESWDTLIDEWHRNHPRPGVGTTPNPACA